MRQFRVLTIGDSMITMTPLKEGPMRMNHYFERKVGGAELNFSIGMARLGLTPSFISRVGKDEFGQYIFNYLRGEGVDVSQIDFVENKSTSLNFREIFNNGDSRTYYYRTNGPILSLEQQHLKEEHIKEMDLIHLSGVYLALDSSTLDIVLRIVEIAKKYNIPVSFDPNLRLKLWSIEEAREAFEKIYPFVQIFLTGEEEIELLIGSANKPDIEIFTGKHTISHFVMKRGHRGASLFTDGEWYDRGIYQVDAVDTVGAGDGFDTGFIYAYLNQLEPLDMLTYGNAAGALVTTVVGDNEGLPSLHELEAFINGTKSIER
ncbi:sugar kinase [Sporosarcina cascadiensis]|uniref:sugar kinase n=1 Tax=Sporosarcina cascadiensis TaxID=2660747 RepID=UPI00129A20BD|nr:sugar kinase [Sporosarcina cascadiensis]